MMTFRIFLLLVIVSFSLVVKASLSETKRVKAAIDCYFAAAISHRHVTGIIKSLASYHIIDCVRLQPATGCQPCRPTPGDLTLMFAKIGYKLFKSDLLSLKDTCATKILIDFQPVIKESTEMWHPLLKLLD